MAAKVKFTLQFRDLKVKLKLPSDTPLAELVSIAKDEFGEYGVDNPVIMYNDDGELLKVPKRSFTIEENAVLIVMTTDAKGNITRDNQPEPEPKKPKTEPEPPKPEPPEPEPPKPEPPKPEPPKPEPPKPEPLKPEPEPPKPTLNESAAIQKWKDKISKLLQNMAPSDAEAARGVKIQGMAFIVGMYDAAGANKDVQAMERLFENNLGFAVVRETNLTAFELKTLVEAASLVDYGMGCKYIVFYYAGHGGTDDYGNSFVCPVSYDKKEFVYMKADIIRKLEHLKRKCLLFMFDCCLNISGGAGQSKEEFGAQLEHTNSYIAFATTFGDKSQGSKRYGGNWTRTLCKKLAEDKDFVTIMEETAYAVKDEYGKLPQRYSNLSKSVNLKATAKTGGIDPLEKKPEMDKLKPFLKSHTYQYDRIGTILGLDYQTRRGIDQDNINNKNAQMKMDAILQEWSNRLTDDAKWKDIIKAFKDDNLNALANEIEKSLKPDD